MRREALIDEKATCDLVACRGIGLLLPVSTQVVQHMRTGREVQEFVDSMFEWEEKRRGPEARYVKRLQVS